ncbi:MAG TPA: biotin/lipoyl-containing protein, partial [Streptosporangiaceae bacterium]|nr:biotin/lipoyl-containing protein [Streptosporangiaceae bacterium]
MTEAVLTRWYKKPGETVAAGEAIAEIETDKSAVDLESPADGVLGPHLVAEGDEVPIGAAVTRIMEYRTDPDPDHQTGPVPGYEPDPFPVPADTGGVAATAGDGAAPDTGTAAGGASVTSTAGTAGGVSAGGVTFPHARTPHALSPRKRMAARLAAEAAHADGALTDGALTDGALTGRRRAVAQAVSESWRTIPHFSVQREIDASDADACLA